MARLFTLDRERGALSDAEPRPDQSFWLAKIAFYGLFLSVAAGPLLALKERASYSGEGNVTRQLLFITVFVLAFFSLYAGRNLRALRSFPMSLALTLAWCWLSLSWAFEPGVGARRLFLTSIVAVTIFVVVEILDFDTLTDDLRRIFVGVLILNFLVVLLIPSVGVHKAAEVTGFGMDPALIGSWKGVLAHKNYAGPFTAVTIIYFIFCRRWSATARIVVIVLSVIFLFGSQSKTSGGLLAISLFVGWLYTHYDFRYRYILVGALLCGLVLLILVGEAYWDEIAAPLKRPDAFTGRVQIWRPLLRFSEDHPWGSGYGSLWNIGSDRPLAHYVGAKSWVALVPEAHNGYLDLLAQIGAFGLCLAMASLLVIPFGNLLFKPCLSPQDGAMLIATLFFCAGHNVTESSFLDRDQIVEVFLLFTIALIEKATSPLAIAEHDRGAFGDG